MTNLKVDISYNLKAMLKKLTIEKQIREKQILFIKNEISNYYLKNTK